MANYIPTIRRRRLGSALRRLREEAGLTTTEVGERLGWSHSKISRIETSKTPVTSADVASLISHYEADRAVRSRGGGCPRAAHHAR